jgi:CheY-like chemotaxis protein
VPGHLSRDAVLVKVDLVNEKGGVGGKYKVAPVAADSQSKPDVAILDLRMPGMSGIEVARQIGRTAPSTAVILYTAFGDRALLTEALDAGARGFVLTQAPDAAFAPPLEPDVRGVEVRGTAGRYTPGHGELEWVEDGRVVSLRSATLSLDELVAVAERLVVLR